MNRPVNMNEDALLACADLVQRTGAREFEVGYLHEDVPIAEAAWYAHAQYQGARITVENLPGPVDAAEALARRLLDGARCLCGKLVATSDAGAFAYDVILLNGERWTPAEAAAAGQCRWRRVGPTWVRGCMPPGGSDPAGPNRAQRRRDKRR